MFFCSLSKRVFCYSKMFFSSFSWSRVIFLRFATIRPVRAVVRGQPLAKVQSKQASVVTLLPFPLPFYRVE